MNVRALVDRIEAVLGPEASPERVEQIAELLLAGKKTAAQNGHAIGTVGTITALRLGVPMLHCASRLPQTVRGHAYDSLRRAAAPFRHVVEELRRNGLVDDAAASAELSPVSLFTGALDAGELVEIALALEEAAEHSGLDGLHGFSAFLSPADPTTSTPFFEALPVVLGKTRRLHTSVDTGAPFHPAIASRLARLIRTVHVDAAPSALTRLGFTVNAGPSRPLGGSFQPIGVQQPVVHATVSSQSILRQALSEVSRKASFDELLQASRQHAFMAGTAAMQLIQTAAEKLRSRMQVPVLAGTVWCTPLGNDEPRTACACSAEDHLLEQSIALGIRAAVPPAAVSPLPLIRTVSVAEHDSEEALAQALGRQLQALQKAGAPGVVRVAP